MKKIYTKPSMEVIKVASMSIIAASIVEGDNTGSTDGALGREDLDDHTPSRPNIWEQGW